MFKNLSNKLSRTLSKIRNYGRLTEQNIQETLDKISNNLLEADVALAVVKKFIQNIKKDAIGKKINNNFTPGQEFIKLVYKNLIKIMDSSNTNINIAIQPPAVILFIGLQGVGKTTSVIKLAYFLKKKYKKKIIVVSTDIYRPAAMKQLQILADNTKIDYLNIDNKYSPQEISKKALVYAKKKFYDILIVDTAGRLHIDHHLMNEIKDIYNILSPIEIIFTVDAMTGQDSINSAKKFNDILPITGIFLTKTDSDTRGGAILSVKYIIKKPIKFIGTGEKINNISIFSPKIIASKILGMSSELSIINDIKKKINFQKNTKLIEKLKNKNELNLQDFLEQIEQIKKVGSKNIINLLNKMKINNIQNIANPILNILNIDNNTIKHTKAIINSMTKFERNNINILNFSRKKRISLGSGVSIFRINAILKQYNQMKLVTKKMKKHHFSKIIKYVKNLFNYKNME